MIACAPRGIGWPDVRTTRITVQVFWAYRAGRIAARVVLTERDDLRMDLAIRITGTMTLGDLIVGLGTLALAGFTYWLGKSARAEGSQVAAQVKIERERLDAESRPYVVPAPDPEWLTPDNPVAGGWSGNDGWKGSLPVKNVGPGAALNIQATLRFGPPSGVTANTLPTSVGPGEREDLLVHWAAPSSIPWQHVEGTLDFEDIGGSRWQTHFRIDEENERRHLRVREVIQVTRADGTNLPPPGSA